MSAASLSSQNPVTAESLRSGKGGGDENFPVASLLIAPEKSARVCGKLTVDWPRSKAPLPAS